MHAFFYYSIVRPLCKLIMLHGKFFVLEAMHSRRWIGRDTVFFCLLES